MPYISSVKDTTERSKYHIGFPRGLNEVQDVNLVDNKNLTAATNCKLVVDGVSRRDGADKVDDQGGASYVYGSGAFYKKSDGTRKWLRMAKISTGVCQLQYLDGSTWTTIGATTWQEGDAYFVQARDKMFIYNGIDNMRYYDGTSVTTYTTVATPTSLAITPTGTSGSTEYTYRVEALNDTGRTAACARVVTTTGHATLSTTNYNALAWDAMADADSYNVYGRVQTGTAELFLATVYTNSYNDTGVDVPTIGFVPNEYNTTGGIIASYAVFALNRQFAIGVTEGTKYYPTRLYYSGIIEYIDAFVGGDYGGGWVDVKSNDGGELIDIVEYQSGVLVIKTNGIYKFYFTSAGLPALEQISTKYGGISYKGGQLVGNDYVIAAQKDNKIAVMTIGQQANYVGDQIRTNDISIFVSDGISTMSKAYMANTATFSYDYQFGLTYTKDGETENTEGYVLDTRFGGWVKWNGLPMACNDYVIYNDGSEILQYGCSNTDGYMIELFTDSIDDNGSSFKTVLSTKSFNQGMFNVEKVYRNPTLWFKYVSVGYVTVEVFADATRKVGSTAIAPSESGTFIGQDLFGETLFGGSVHDMTSSEIGADYPVDLVGLMMERSIRFTLTDESLGSNWLFMGVNIKYTPLEGKPLDTQYQTYLT